MKKENTNKPLTCDLCGHVWIPRKEQPPVQCPRCKRYDWNKEILS